MKSSSAGNRFALSSGESLYYEDTGQGDRTLIMIHGWISTHEVFDPVLPILRGRARCITYDHRGHGKSKDANRCPVTMDTLADDLNELICGLGLRKVTLLGWSMGAGVVMNYLAAYGCSAVRRVILCDMAPKLLNDADWKLGLCQGQYSAEDNARDQEKNFYAQYRSFAAASIPWLARVPGFLLRYPLKKRLAACDETVLRSLAESMKEKDYRDSVERITVPVRYFYAVPGSLFSPALADWYASHVRAPFRAEAFPHSSHMLISEHPGRFGRAVLRALEERESDAAFPYVSQVENKTTE